VIEGWRRCIGEEDDVRRSGRMEGVAHALTSAVNTILLETAAYKPSQPSKDGW
jgi:hypothetical protein